MLSETQVWAPKIHNKLFCYMPPYPIKWNSTFTQLELTKPFKRWIPYLILMAWTLFTGICCNYAVVTFYFLCPRKDFTILGCLILSYATIFFYFICAGTFYFLANVKTLLYMHKDILGVKNAVIKICYYRLTASQKFDVSRSDTQTANFIVLVNIVCALGPFIAHLVCLIVEYDVFDVLLEAYLLDDPLYRSRLQIILGPVISSLFLFPCHCECFRGIAVFVTDLFILVDSFCTIYYLSENAIFNLSCFRSLYIILTLISKVFKDLLELFLCLLLTVIFWILVSCMWINVKGFALVGSAVQAGCVAITCVSVVSLFVFFTKFTKIITRCVQLVERHVRHAKREFVMKKTMQTKIELKQAKALYVIRFKYGSFFYISKDSFGEYLYLLTQRIADVILIY